MTARYALARDVPIRGRTALAIGGLARAWLEADSPEGLKDAWAWAQKEGLSVCPLGDGSNIVVSDHGYEGALLVYTADAIAFEPTATGARVNVQAGASWHHVAMLAAKRGLTGIEAMVGIPGRAGAAPVQNIGAYGQELKDVLLAVEVMDLQTGTTGSLSAEALGLGYRTSHLKTLWRNRFMVLALTLELSHCDAPNHSLRAFIARNDMTAFLKSHPVDVAAHVMALRQKKGMLWQASPPLEHQHKSVGSFFCNPTLDLKTRQTLVATHKDAPVYQKHATTQVSAAWLVEKAGFVKGWIDAAQGGRTGVSPHHSLALINRGGAKAQDIVATASTITQAVHKAFGITLTPEPVWLGPADARWQRLSKGA